MPLNDKLLQITRKSQTEWDTKNVLSVSFSTLLLPSGVQNDEDTVVALRKNITYTWILTILEKTAKFLMANIHQRLILICTMHLNSMDLSATLSHY